MAYLDLTANYLTPRSAHARSTAIDHVHLSSIERDAVMLARRDRMSSLRQPGRLRRAATFVFGLPVKTGLADAKLEGLRRFAVAAAHGNDKAVDRERSAILKLGYSETQARRAEILALQCRPREATGIINAIVFAAVVACGTWFIQHMLGDVLISFVLMMLLGLPVWIAAAPRALTTSPSRR